MAVHPRNVAHGQEYDHFQCRSSSFRQDTFFGSYSVQACLSASLTNSKSLLPAVAHSTLLKHFRFLPHFFGKPTKAHIY